MQTGGAKVKMALMNCLTRDHHVTYHFQRVINPTLRSLMPDSWRGNANWRRSLGTKDPKQSKRRYPAMLAECNTAFEAAERAERGETAPSRPR